MPKKRETAPTPAPLVPASKEDKKRHKTCKVAARLLTKRNKLLNRVSKLERTLIDRVGLSVTDIIGVPASGRVKRRQVARALGYPA